jgi:hypothetical protein
MWGKYGIKNKIEGLWIRIQWQGKKINKKYHYFICTDKFLPVTSSFKVVNLQLSTVLMFTGTGTTQINMKKLIILF